MNTTKANIIINQSDNFDDFYEYADEIGKGRYATVKKCYCKKTQKCYAAKVIKNFRTKITKFNMNIVENEVTALTLARSHSAIVHLYQVFYQRSETILVLEYATEKDLHLYLDIEGAFEEEKACIIVYQVLKAIEFLHSKQILHLDIKPENVLLMTPLTPNGSLSPANDELENDENVQPLNMNMNQPITNNPNINNNNNNNKQAIKVKLCDFSFSQVITPGKQILGMMGTVAYSAPEVLQYEPLTKATDMWSLGVLVHVLLTGYTPFGNGAEKSMQTETNILSVREKEFKCLEEYFENVSPEAQDFIESLLKFKPKHRLTVEEALNHKWFQKYSMVDYEHNNDLLSLETIANIDQL